MADNSIGCRRFISLHEDLRMISPTVIVEHSSAVKRYADAFQVAKVLVGLGTTLKIVAAVAALIIGGISLLVLIIGVVSLTESAAGFIFVLPSIAGFFFAILVGVLIFLFGVLVAAHGQILRATLDAAVNSSPFLSDSQKAEAMSLTVIAQARKSA
jgi:hypothetical protein